MKQIFYRYPSLIILVGLLVLFSLFFSPSNVKAETCSAVSAPLPQFVTDGVNRNLDDYIKIMHQTGVPWEMLAAIHYRETNFSRSNPSNGYGIFQFTPPPRVYPPGPVSDIEFQNQLKYMADRLQSDYVWRNGVNKATDVIPRKLLPNEKDMSLIKNTLYSYNGRADVYAQQAKTLGFSQPYEGSPYVMNKFDCQRSSMGLITKDYGSMDGIDTRYGAYTLYDKLKQKYNTSAYFSLPGCSEATGTARTCLWMMRSPDGKTYYTSHVATRDNLVIRFGYKYIWSPLFGNSISLNGNVPVYRVVKPDGGSLLTTDKNEYDTLTTLGFVGAGVDFYADPPNRNSGFNVYRLFKSTTNEHIYVNNINERNRMISLGFKDEGVAFSSISSVKQEVAPPEGKQLVYRFYIPQSRSHFWTTDLTERDKLIKLGYKYEGVSWLGSVKTSDLPVYRLYSDIVKKHLYTTSVPERDNLVTNHRWRYEGISYYVSKSANNKPVYRLYSPLIFSHLLTTDSNERDVLSKSGVWRYEGIAWYQP